MLRAWPDCAASGSAGQGGRAGTGWVVLDPPLHSGPDTRGTNQGDRNSKKVAARSIGGSDGNGHGGRPRTDNRVRSDFFACARNQGGDVGRISSYSEVSSALPILAATMLRSSSISALVKVLRNLVKNCPSFTCPARTFNPFTSASGASRTR